MSQKYEHTFIFKLWEISFYIFASNFANVNKSYLCQLLFTEVTKNAKLWQSVWLGSRKQVLIKSLKNVTEI